MSPADHALALLCGLTPWTGHDVIVITAATAARVTERVARLQRLFTHTPVHIHGVVDDRHDGNLGGTVRAWEAVRADVPVGARVAIVHDAGHASRSTDLTRLTDGTRGALRLGARVTLPSGTLELDLLGLVSLLTALVPGLPAYVDVFWGSQLCLPTRLDLPTGALSKLAWRPTGTPTPLDRAELGWFALDAQGAVLDFAAQGTLGSAEAFASWSARWPSVAADVGSAALQRDLLDALHELVASAPPRRRDLDPQLTRPWVRLLAGGDVVDEDTAEVASLLSKHPALAQAGAVTARALDGAWWRLRHPAEVGAALRAVVGGDPQLGALWEVAHPVSRSFLGGRWLEGPELSWEEVAQGVEIGGVRLRASVVRDAVLHPGSDVDHAVVVDTAGTLHARDAVVLGSAGVLSAHDDVLAGRVGSQGTAPLDDDPLTRDVAWLAEAPLSHPGARLRLDRIWDAVRADDARFDTLLTGLLVPAGDALDAERLDHARGVLAHGWRRLAAAGAMPDPALVDGSPAVSRPQASAPPTDPHTVAVLSRVSVGADVAIVTPLLLRLADRWPRARLLVVGGRLGGCLPAGAEHLPLPFDRGAGLSARLAAWQAVRIGLASAGGADAWVVTPESRLDQVGTLPIAAAEATAMVDLSARTGTMAARVQGWADAVLGAGPSVVPTLVLSPADVDAAAAVDQRVGLTRRGFVAIKYGVAGDASKALSAQAETDHLLACLRRGPVLLDVGWGAAEEASSSRLVAAAQAAGHTVATAAEGNADTSLVTWRGSLPAWAALLARCRAALGYDSVQGHLAAADKVVDGVCHPGTPVTVLFLSPPSERFVEAWTPTGRSRVRVVFAQADVQATIAAWAP